MKYLTVTVKDWRTVRNLREEMGVTHNSQVVNILLFLWGKLPNDKKTMILAKYDRINKTKQVINNEKV